MRFNRLGAFTLGVVITAVSVGAVSFVNAAGDATLKACANKKTGVMRHISKGSCNKKTETTLSWNQMGPQGLPGSSGTAGAKGDTGTAGAKGDTGTAGTNGTTGTSGQNFYAIDATGKDLGIITQASASYIVVFSQGGLWDWSTEFYGGGPYLYLFKDSSCTIPMAAGPSALDTPSYDFSLAQRWTLAKSLQRVPTAAYKATGQKFGIESLTTIYIWSSQNQTCTSRTPLNYFVAETWVTNLVEVALPTYTAPLTIVAK
jgi:hypothetical protein